MIGAVINKLHSEAQDLLAIKGSQLLWAHGSETTAQEAPYGWTRCCKLVEFKMNKFVRFVKDESGATAIEYGLIAAAMGLALVTAMPILATAVTGKFSSLAGHITSGK